MGPPVPRNMARAGVLSCILFFLLSDVSECGTVTTKSGVVRGGLQEFSGLHRNGSYHSFQGIPYAKPPVGRLRFQPPLAVTAWEEELDASGEAGSQCLQPEYFDPEKFGQISGDEDCLTLNIYSEALPQESRNLDLKPVFFWIHGGAFAIGAGSMFGQQPDLLLESGMVVVTINYRLGALGFMAIEGSDISGNQGLKDQLLALRWVKENIANFGGDPNRITIAGESAGAFSVHGHILSPLAKDEDLFHAGISFSGTMLMGMDNMLTQALVSSRTFLERECQLSVETEESDLEDSCLYTLSALDIIAKTNNLELDLLPIRERVEKNEFTYMFWPIVDYWAEDAFMPTHPVTVLHNQKQKMVPFMTGITSDEGAMISAPNWKYMKEEDNQVQEFWDVLAGKLMASKGYDPTFEEKFFYRMVAKFYFGGVEGITRENKQAFTDLITDVYMAHPNYETVKLQAQSPAPVYNYLMSYRGTLSLSSVFAGGDPEAMAEDFGVAHADDLLYTWKISMGNYTALTTENGSLFAENWIGLISNFAKYGNPTPVTSGSETVWPEAQKSRAACVYLQIGLENQEKHRIFPERMEFWNRVVFQEMLDKYAISEEEDELLVEIDSALVESVDDDDDDDDNSVEEHHHRGSKKHKRGRKGFYAHLKSKRSRGQKNGNWRSNSKRRMLKKRKRLGRKLKQIKCK